jgi:hypothetical protein
MKKIKRVFIATAVLGALGAAFAFNRPTTGCGWQNEGSGWQQYFMGTLPGEYTCDASMDVTCTYQDDHITRCNKGIFFLH